MPSPSRGPRGPARSHPRGAIKRAQPQPNNIAGLHSWYKADALVLNDNDPITTWTDSSGGGHDVTQAVAGSKPTYKTSILNSKPVARCDSGDYLQSGAFTESAQPHTIFITCQTSSGANRNVFDGIGAGTSRHTTYFNGTAAGGFLYAGAVLNVSTIGTSWFTAAIVWNGASTTMYKNGGAAFVTGDAGSNTLTGITIGARYDGLEPWTGDIAEVIVYTAQLTNSNINDVGNYLGTKYAIAWTTI